MSDTELDEILDTWSAPAAPASLRERVRAGFNASIEEKTIPAAPQPWTAAFARRARKGLLVVAMVALGAFVLVVTQAIPQTLKLVSPQVPIPYTVDSKFVRYTGEGSGQVEMYTTSYSHDGIEILLSRTLPGNPIGTAIARTLDVGFHIMPPRRSKITPEMAERLRDGSPFYISLYTGCDRPTCWLTEHYTFIGIGGEPTGCAETGVIGREKILNYPTVAAQLPLGDSKRMTLWMAPDLGCFALRMTLEERGPDGTFRLASGKQAVKVTWNP